VSELVLHFLKFAIESRSLDVDPWVERLYASNDVTGRFPAHAAHLRLLLERRDSPHAFSFRPLGFPAFAETHLGLGACYYEEGRFVSANDAHLWHEMEYDVAGHTIRANLGGRYVENPHSIITYVVRPILKGFLMPFYRLATVHAASVVKDDRTVFLAGGPGAGKSTTAIHLMLAGWDLLSDDRTFLTVAGDTAYALSSLDALHVTDQTLRLFPALGPHVVGDRDEGGKWSVGLEHLPRGTAWREPRRVTDFIQLRRGPVARAGLSPLTRSQALEDLLRDTMVVFRARAFRAAPYPFREYSDFILAALTALVSDARLSVLEFADADLPRIPALLDAARSV